MPDIQLGVIEARFAGILWQHAPVTTSELVKLAEKEFGWKRTTTHTVIRRLCDKGLFENRGGTVFARISQAQFASMQSRSFVEDTFSGSLPAFLAAFTQGRRLTHEEAAALREMIDHAEVDSQ